MKIGVVFPVINCLAYTQAAVASLKSVHELQVIVVDNGSMDGTKEWAVGSSHVDAVIRNEHNAGLTHAWNQGVERARELGCTYVLLTNNDVLYHPQTVDNLVAALEAHPDWGMATGVNDKGWCDANGGPQAIFTKPLPAEPSDAEHPDFSCFMLRLDAYDRVGPFDEEFSRRGRAYYEDNDYHRRMRLLGIPARSTTAAPYYHYTSMTLAANPGAADSGLNRAYYIEKWGGLPEHEQFATPFNR